MDYRISMSLLAIFMLFSGRTAGQRTTVNSCYYKIKAYDFTKILATDSFLAEDMEGYKAMMQKPEPLGFIGGDFQRFFIHFTSIQKNRDSPYEYIVAGKTKVKKNICDFKGTFKVIAAGTYHETNPSKYKRGFVVCDVLLFEDKKQSLSGFIKGKMTSYFIVDGKNRCRYDGSDCISDGFSNNQFVGSWVSYRTNTSKICHWGDFRIPDSRDLDIGAGAFSVSEKYVQNGWINYRLASGHTPEAEKARRVELQEWWR